MNLLTIHETDQEMIIAHDMDIGSFFNISHLSQTGDNTSMC